MLLHTSAPDFQKVFATNDTNESAFGALAATITEPTGPGVLTIGGPGRVPQWLSLIPYGIGADDTTMKLRVVGWRQVSGLWVWSVLAAISATLSTQVGVAGQSVLNTERFADTLTIDLGAAPDVVVVSPTSNAIARAKIATLGHYKIQVQPHRNSSATSTNALWAVY